MEHASSTTAVLDTARSFRVRTGRRQDDTAKRAGVSTRTLCKLEAGDLRVRLVSAERVARELDLPLGTYVESVVRTRLVRRSLKSFHLNRRRAS